MQPNDHAIQHDPETGDSIRPQRKIERVRQWEPLGRSDCPRRDRPVFTPPGQLPEPCGTTKRGRDFYACGGEEWRSKGIVIRDEGKRVIHREKMSG
jgi:hypothetical protein